MSSKRPKCEMDVQTHFCAVKWLLLVGFPPYVGVFSAFFLLLGTFSFFFFFAPIIKKKISPVFCPFLFDFMGAFMFFLILLLSILVQLEVKYMCAITKDLLRIKENIFHNKLNVYIARNIGKSQ